MILSSSWIPQLCTACVIVTLTSPTCCDPPLFIGNVFLTPLDSSQLHVSKMATTSGANFFARGTASWMWSKCPCVMQIVSTFLISKFLGYRGLPVHGSIRIACPEGSRKRKVPCPSHVISIRQY